MSKRLNVILPNTTVAVLEQVAPGGKRSSFISQAVLHFVRTRGRQSLRERLKPEAEANAERDLALARDWFPLEEAAWESATGSKKRG